ncbi:Os09g0271775 [Oryza sativa Japonica Group]|uniref:Os09g0271775 protein n=1 Tax=Oryza sativa subsp. japonica TaxID=39947 RepID=A0A0P0XKJ5_ORYSJ|nr:Os09g0271775 [Oryza sativa Japonica Group]
MRGRGIEKTGEEDARRRGGQQRGGTTSGHRGGTAVRKVGGQHGVGHQSMEMRLYGGDDRVGSQRFPAHLEIGLDVLRLQC